MKVKALTAGLLVLLTLGSTASAGETGEGNAWGNCKNSAAGGEREQLEDSPLKNLQGLGGFSKDSTCTAGSGSTAGSVTGGGFSDDNG